MVYKHESAIEKAIANNPCGICRVLNLPVCTKHAKKGGDGDETKDKGAAPAVSVPSQVMNAVIQEFNEAKAIITQSLLSSDKIIQYEAGLLSIESNKVHGTLTFQIQAGLSKDDMELSRQYLKMIEKEFDKFKDKLTELGVLTKNFSIDTSKDNELTIHIPNPKYYVAFIKLLEEKNLLAIPNFNQQKQYADKEQISHRNNSISYPRQLSTKLERK